ncbi:flagellar export chaperone FliS [Saccharothrix violaceirubra]|uniref:Flagellar protein FliS n=1 Tax=Saccharothrix violaceirubra TaxID=413306 RepID=A0A7W7TAR2_9PSEU|nr:flagellar export chaperone FliS [Saccharothrix violaceirubra]MBB4968355.1 flagellar protein FliS [Saccharothrix violaceirubra]
MSTSALRARYLTDSVSTASPSRLLVMLYDRLCLDLDKALTAIASGEREAASVALVHAQDIVLELRGSLKLDEWAGARGLADLYTFMTSELMRANLQQDAGRVRAVLALVEPLREAWRQAAEVAADER